jgi:hypothetical protein
MTCSVDDCDRKPRSRGLCNSHYENLRRYGHVVATRHLPLYERCARTGWDVTEAGCWEYRGRRNEHGYGMYGTSPGYRVHRISYEHHVGPIPDGLILRHTCDNPPCCNPEHLVPGTPADNAQDKMDRGRAIKHWRTGLCAKGHDITLPENVKTVKRKGRANEIACKICTRERQARWSRKGGLDVQEISSGSS